MKSNRSTRVLISMALIGALATTSTQAALLTNVEGSVSVNRGDGYRPVGEAGASLVAGDRVHSASGSANIVYENGCAQRVEPDQTVIVLSVPPLCGNSRDSVSVNEGNGTVLGLSTQTVLIGGVVVGGAVGLGLALSSNSNGSVSP